jgi:ankyrin repeat protein
MRGNDSKPNNLITVAYQGDVKTAIAQLDGGGDVNARDCDGDTALMLAAERGHIELVKVLLKNGADVNAANLNGETALMRAAENDRAAAVKLLLAHHANGNAGDIINCTPLMRAAYRGYVDCERTACPRSRRECSQCIWQHGRDSRSAQWSRQGRKHAAESRWHQFS